MNGFIKSAAAGLCLGAGALSSTGCTQYRQHVDPCWPERYNAEARRTTNEYFDAQAYNGHVLDQTIWNWDFERDDKGQPTDKLTIGAQERLKYLVRRRPVADGRLYLQTANDLAVGNAIEQIPNKRQDIDTKRVASVQRYLNAVTAGRSTPVAWDIAVHDPAEAYLPANVVGGITGSNNVVQGAYPRLTTNFQGVMGTVTGFTLSGGGGGGGGGGAGGGGAPGTGNQSGGGAQQGGGAPPGGQN